MLSPFENRIQQRNDRRRSVTRTALIEAAESLFAKSGFESVSTRDIGKAINSKNMGIVRYYFGNKQNLLDVIFHYRMQNIELNRKNLLIQPNVAPREKAIFQLFYILAFSIYQCNGDKNFFNFSKLMVTCNYERWWKICIEGDEIYNATSRIYFEISGILANHSALNNIIQFIHNISFTTVCSLGQATLKTPAEAHKLAEHTAAYALNIIHESFMLSTTLARM